jgi:hypothetical protein
MLLAFHPSMITYGERKVVIIVIAPIESNTDDGYFFDFGLIEIVSELNFLMTDAKPGYCASP